MHVPDARRGRRALLAGAPLVTVMLLAGCSPTAAPPPALQLPAPGTGTIAPSPSPWAPDGGGFDPIDAPGQASAQPSASATASALPAPQVSGSAGPSGPAAVPGLVAPTLQASARAVAAPVGRGGSAPLTSRPQLAPTPSAAGQQDASDAEYPKSQAATASPLAWPAGQAVPSTSGSYLKPWPVVRRTRPLPSHSFARGESLLDRRVDDAPADFGLRRSFAGASFAFASANGDDGTQFSYLFDDPLPAAANVAAWARIAYASTASALVADGWVEVAVRKYPLRPVGSCPGMQVLGQFARDNQWLMVDVHRSGPGCLPVDNGVHLLLAGRWD